MDKSEKWRQITSRSLSPLSSTGKNLKVKKIALGSGAKVGIKFHTAYLFCL